jgi:EAL domain-containing protein (putative c-di-GMP-specific phosphodiesterase class I)/GGDEF domain-containing protein
MIGPRATLLELTEALDAAGVGVYLYEGARQSQRWLVGAERYRERAGASDDARRAALTATTGPGDALHVAGGDGAVSEQVVRLRDGPEGNPRFVGVLRAADAATPGASAGGPDPLRRRDGRGALQAHLTHLGESLPTGTPVAFCAFGVDGLREFCRAYGYDAGDALAVAVGARLALTLPPDAAFVRLGGAKFGAAIVGDTAGMVRARAEAISAEIRRASFDVGFGPVSVTVSVGAAIADVAALTSPEPLDAALAALDEACGEGDNGMFIADRDVADDLSPSAMRDGARAVMRALEADRVAIAFQPVVSATATGRVAFRECLARVQDDAGNWIAAGRFLPKIERLDLVRALDRRMLRLALRVLAEHPTERLSVNVSVRTMRDRAWLSDLAEAAAGNPGCVERLIVELTESAAVVDVAQTKRFLDEIRALGVAIALDDFGAGYFSFRHVRDFRPDWVKIDGSFIQGVANDPDNKLFVDTLVGIARNFDMATVAEFVENEEDAEALRALGVDCFQGYLYGEPMIEPDWRAAENAAVGLG